LTLFGARKEVFNSLLKRIGKIEYPNSGKKCLERKSPKARKAGFWAKFFNR